MVQNAGNIRKFCTIFAKYLQYTCTVSMQFLYNDCIIIVQYWHKNWTIISQFLPSFALFWHKMWTIFDNTYIFCFKIQNCSKFIFLQILYLGSKLFNLLHKLKIIHNVQKDWKIILNVFKEIQLAYFKWWFKMVHIHQMDQHCSIFTEMHNFFWNTF